MDKNPLFSFTNSTSVHNMLHLLAYLPGVLGLSSPGWYLTEVQATNRKKKGSSSQIASQLLKSFATKETLSFEALYFGKPYQTSCYMLFFQMNHAHWSHSWLQTCRPQSYGWLVCPTCDSWYWILSPGYIKGQLNIRHVGVVCVCWQSKEKLTKGTSQTFPTKEIWNIPSNLLSPSTTFQPW